MRKALLVTAVLLLLAVPASAQRGGCCQSVVGPKYEAVTIGLAGYDEHGCRSGDLWLGLEPCVAAQPTPEPTVAPPPTSVPTVVPPEPTPTPIPIEAGWWGLIKAWADKFTIWKGTPGSVISILAVLASFLAIVQTAKKLLEAVEKWEWIIKLIPGLGTIVAFFAHGIGPMILNGLITGGTLLVVALQDGMFTAGEAIAIVCGVVGTDVLYRLVRGFIFPSTKVVVP